ncbi:MAG: alpha/beta fold hydrolase [Candidatus Obscuribacterales bacterium]|jgi:pimeloyl-ACP methyl ester carboxylesterase|nr:alpha/beta fold hydrolase [Candidatus Obscuribacterales bacterium]
MNQALSSDSVQRRTFVSTLDANMDTYAFQAPSYTPNVLDYTLVVYLHGMGSNYMEPFVTPSEQTIASALTRDIPRVGLLSCSYRKDAAWGSDAAMADIIQNTRQVLQEFPFKSIVVMGTSMGGCVALNFAATAPEDIKQKIIGVVSMEASGDLVQLFKISAHRDIRPAMMIAFGGTPEQIPDVYRRKSFLSNIDGLPTGAKVYILSARADRIVPPELQKAVVEELKKRSVPVQFEEIDGQHRAPAASFYAKGLNFVLGK